MNQPTIIVATYQEMLNHPIVVVVVVVSTVAVASIAFMKNLNHEKSSTIAMGMGMVVALVIIATAVLMVLPIYPKGENDSPLLHLTGLTTGVTIIILGILLFFYYIGKDFIKTQVNKAKKNITDIDKGLKIDRTEIIKSAIAMKEYGLMARAFIESMESMESMKDNTKRIIFDMAEALRRQRENKYTKALYIWKEMSDNKNTSNSVRAAAFASCGYLSLSSPEGKDDPKKDYGKASEDFDKAIKLKPGYPEAYCYRGLAKVRQTQYTDAIKDFEQAINLKPGYPEAYCYRGLVKVRQAQYKEAIKDFDMALKVKSDCMEAYYYRGLANVKLKNYNDSLPDLSMAIKLYEGNLAPPSKDAEPKN